MLLPSLAKFSSGCLRGLVGLGLWGGLFLVGGVGLLGAQVRLEKNLFRSGYAPLNSSYPQSFARVGEEVYFIGISERVKGGLWRTNPRTGVTRRIMVLPMGYELGNIEYSALFPVGRGAVVFWSGDGGGILKVYFSDGTPGRSGLVSSGRRPLGPFPIFHPGGNRVLAVDSLGIHLMDPFTRRGLTLKKGAFSGGSLLATLPAPRGKWRVLFVVEKGGVPGKRQLWVSNGTVVGTRFVSRIASINSGLGSFVRFPQAAQFKDRILFTLLGQGGMEYWSIGLDLKKVQLLYGRGKFWDNAFLGWRGGRAVYWSGKEVFETDGTAAGTKVLLPASLQFLGAPVLLKEKFYFSRSTPKTGAEIFVSDGTPGGTRLFIDLVPGPLGAGPGDLRRAGNRFFFDTKKMGFWVSYGTLAGTRNLDPQLSFDSETWARGTGFYEEIPGGSFLFAGRSKRGEVEPFLSDGTRAGTRILAQIAPDSDGDGAPGPLLPGAQGLFFQAFVKYKHGSFFKGTGGSVGKGFGMENQYAPLVRPALMTAGARLLYLERKGEVGPKEAWVSDGTKAGALRVHGFLNPAPKEIQALFGGLGTESLILGRGHRLWRTDGTKTGSVSLGQPFGTQGLGTLRVLPGPKRFWFLHEQKARVSLWKLDRGAAKLSQVKSFGARPAAAACLQALGDRCVFQVLDPVQGHQLWVSDGSAAGTRLLAKTPGPLHADPKRPPLLLGGRLYLYGDSVQGKRAFYRTDGSPKGTARAFVVPAQKMKSMEAVATEGRIFLLASDAKTGTELWVSDGSQKGSRMVGDLFPGPEGSLPTRLGRVGSRRVFFYAFRPGTGTELWVSDGTAVGTRMVKDLYPGINPLDVPGSVTPPRFQGGRIYFGAQSPNVGFELHSMGSGAVAEVIGGGCRDRVLPLRGTDPVLGGKATVRGESPKGTGLRVLLLGKPSLRLISLPGGCSGVLDPSAPFLILDAASSTGGAWTRKYSIPKLPSLNGVQLALQAFYWKPGSPPKASQGLAWALGS